VQPPVSLCHLCSEGLDAGRQFCGDDANSVASPWAGLVGEKRTGEVGITHFSTSEANKLLGFIYLQNRQSQFPPLIGNVRRSSAATRAIRRTRMAWTMNQRSLTNGSMASAWVRGIGAGQEDISDWKDRMEGLGTFDLKPVTDECENCRSWGPYALFANPIWKVGEEAGLIKSRSRKGAGSGEPAQAWRLPHRLSSSEEMEKVKGRTEVRVRRRLTGSTRLR